MPRFSSRSFFFDLLSLFLGALLPLAFAPFDLYPLAWFIPAVLILFWNTENSKHVFWRGFLFGLGFFGVGVSWVFVSIHVYGHTSSFLAGFLTFLFVAVLALFPATQALAYQQLFLHRHRWIQCLGFAGIWVLWEWGRGTLLTGFPWLFLGYSQMESPLSGFIPVLGVYGSSFVTVLTGTLIVSAFIQKKQAMLSISIAGGILLSGFLLSYIPWTTAAKQATFSLIQGNIPQENKWDSQFVESIIDRYVSLTRGHWSSQFIIWPEAALPIPLPLAAPLLNQLNKEAQKHQGTIITGALEYTAGGRRFYNSVVAVGKMEGAYYKRHLVPFGEYLPLEKALRGIIQFFNLPSSYTVAGSEDQPALTQDQWRIAPLICYEIAYAGLAREAALISNVFLTVSNDTWFGRSLGPLQHLQIAQFRALETGRYVVRATNSGYTAIIDQKGKISAEIPAFSTDVLTGSVYTTEGNTPIVQLGHAVILFLILGLVLVLAMMPRGRRAGSH